VVSVAAAATLAGGVTAAIECNAEVSAGQLTIPSWVLLSLAPYDGKLISTLVLEDLLRKPFAAPGLDVSTISWSTGYSVGVKWQ